MPTVRIGSVRTICVFLAVIFLPRCIDPSFGQGALPPAPRTKQVHVKRVLVIGQTKGFEHDSITAAMVAIYNMGQESGLWDATLRTDTELLTKKHLDRNAKSLNDFDLIVFTSTTGELDMDAEPEARYAVVRPRRRQRLCRNSRRARYQLQLAGVRRNDRRLV